MIGSTRPSAPQPKRAGAGLGRRFPDACYEGGGALGCVRLGGGGRRRTGEEEGEELGGCADDALHTAAPDPGECGLVPPPPPLPPPGPSDKGRKEGSEEEPAPQPLTGLRTGGKARTLPERAPSRGEGWEDGRAGAVDGGGGPRGTEAVAGFPCPRRMGSSRGAAAWGLKGAASAAAAAMAAGSSRRLQLLLAQ